MGPLHRLDRCWCSVFKLGRGGCCFFHESSRCVTVLGTDIGGSSINCLVCIFGDIKIFPTKKNCDLKISATEKSWGYFMYFCLLLYIIYNLYVTLTVAYFLWVNLQQIPLIPGHYHNLLDWSLQQNLRQKCPTRTAAGATHQRRRLQPRATKQQKWTCIFLGWMF